MRLNIPSLLIGILLGFCLFFGTLTVWAQATINSTQTIILQETISTTVKLEGKDVPATIQMDLEIVMDELEEAVATPTKTPSDSNNPAPLFASAGEDTQHDDDGTPNLIRNIMPPTDKGLKITSPHIAFDKETELLTFGTEIGMLLNIHSINAKSKVAGEGIKQVIFRVTDLETNEIVYSHQESSSLYCLFGGDTVKECEPKTFIELDNRWPSSKKRIYNGDYNMNVHIITEDDYGDWNFPIRIQGGLERP